MEQFPLTPMTGIAFRPYDSNGLYLNTNKLEEGSTVDIEPIFEGEEFEQIYAGIRVRVTGFDIEATATNLSKFIKFNNMETEIIVECLGGGLINTGPFTYKCFQDFLPKRGMRIVHQFDGVCTYLPWVTFMDTFAWPQQLAVAIARGVKISS